MSKKRNRNPDKTNAARQLDRLGIDYRLRTYPVGEEHLSAAEVAAAVGLLPERVFKTLVVRGDRTGPLFVVVPSTSEIDLKAAARASDNRSVAMVRLDEVTALTGYVRGGTTALAVKKAFPVVLDDTATTLETLVVSAGRRGMQLELDPADYVRATSAIVASVSRPPETE